MFPTETFANDKDHYQLLVSHAAIEFGRTINIKLEATRGLFRADVPINNC